MKDAFGWINKLENGPTKTALIILAQNLMKLDTDRITALEEVVPGPTTAFYQTVSDEGSPLAQEPELDFQGAGVTVIPGLGKTVVQISGGGGSGGDSFLEWTM